MIYTVKSLLPVILRGFLAAVLVGTVCIPCEAQNLKERLKNPFGKKGGTEEQESTGQAKEVPGGMQEILLVSKPKHGGKVPKNSTIAFIRFDHIETDILENAEDAVCAALVASALAQHLSDLNQYRIVTRSHLQSVLDEQVKTHSGSFRPSTAAKLGELTGADILVYGQVQLCVPNLRDSPQEDSPAPGTPADPRAKVDLGIVKIPVGKKEKEKRRSYVIAHIELIATDTGDHVFTTGLKGEYDYDEKKEGFKITDRELLARAADSLANAFVDNFLARREPRYVNLYAGQTHDLDRGVDLIRLGDCAKAEEHFNEVYMRHRRQMNDLEIAKVMYNHGIALMCSNRPEEAEARLWASLRLLNDANTFHAINIANDTIDRGRIIMVEEDPIIQDMLGSRPTSPTVEGSDFSSTGPGGN